ncbi:MAG: hypothetical protein OHK0031_08300 [Anaerolineales bacterium]
MKSKTVSDLGILGQILMLFFASLAPLMFLVGMIAGIDRWATQNRFIQNLETYGKTTQARISYIDEENHRAGVDYLDAAGQERFGTLELRYYSPDVLAKLNVGDRLQIIYIDALVSENEKTALAGELAAVKNTLPVSADIGWTLLISWLIVAVKPQFVFLGIVDFDNLMADWPPKKSMERES